PDVTNRRRRAPTPIGGDVQRRVLDEDRTLELLQLDPGLEPELVVQEPPGLTVDLEALRLPPASVEREHQLRPESLAEGVLATDCLELRDEREVAAERELGVDPLLECGEPKLFEPLRLDPG